MNMKLSWYLLWIPLIAASSAAQVAQAAQGYPYQSCFEIASRMHDVPVDLLLAVAATESAWDPDARSAAQAHGIMQIQWPGTARHLGVQRVSELYNPCLNIELGARYLKELLNANSGDVERALAAYNYGPTRIGRSTTLPDGAKRYAAKVASHQQAINKNVRSTLEDISADNDIAFDSSSRAERFASTLNRKISSARFNVLPAEDGSHVVRMQVKPSGLSTTDIATLTTLGWNGMGTGR